MRIFQRMSYLINYKNCLLENLIKEKYIELFIDNIWGADLADM